MEIKDYDRRLVGIRVLCFPIIGVLVLDLYIRILRFLFLLVGSLALIIVFSCCCLF